MCSDFESIMYIMTPLLSFSLIITVLLRYGASEYDPMNRIYPWPIPADRKAIFFSLIVSFSETFNSSGVVPGVNVALDIINSNDSNLLSGYSLHYILSDSQVRLIENVYSYKIIFFFCSVQEQELWMFSFNKFSLRLSTIRWLS